MSNPFNGSPMNLQTDARTLAVTVELTFYYYYYYYVGHLVSWTTGPMAFFDKGGQLVPSHPTPTGKNGMGPVTMGPVVWSHKCIQVKVCILASFVISV